MNSKYPKTLQKFTRTWGPKNPQKYREFMEDLRELVVETKSHFREEQMKGRFLDKTGDLYLKSCRESFTKE